MTYFTSQDLNPSISIPNNWKPISSHVKTYITAKNYSNPELHYPSSLSLSFCFVIFFFGLFFYILYFMYFYISAVVCLYLHCPPYVILFTENMITKMKFYEMAVISEIMKRINLDKTCSAAYMCMRMCMCVAHVATESPGKGSQAVYI